MKKKKLIKIVTALIFVKKQLLLQLRDNNRKTTFPNTWGFISGGLDDNENPITGIKREILEELSIKKLKNIKLSNIFIDKKNPKIINYVFSSFLNKKPKIILKEGIEYSYFSKKEILRGSKYSKKLKGICFLAQPKIMKNKYFKSLKN